MKRAETKGAQRNPRKIVQMKDNSGWIVAEPVIVVEEAAIERV